MKVRLAAVLVFVGSASGCFPYHFTTRIGISGTVVDARNSTPIPDATVIISDPANQQVASASTDASGRFRIAPHRVWWIYIVPMDAFPYRTPATISALGYESTSIAVVTNPMGPKELSLGEIHLEPRAQ